MLPKIKIVYSRIYDIAFCLAYGKKYDSTDEMRGRAYAKKLQKAWDKAAKKILLLMENFSGMKWKEHAIKAYVVKHLDWEFSDPITLTYTLPIQENIEVLVHELSHNLEYQNPKRVDRKKLEKTYSREHFVVVEHIVPQAILWLAYEKFYGPQRRKNIIESYKGWPYHYRAWKIVERDGAEEIVRRFVKP